MKLELPVHKKLVFSMTLPIRWGDMDAMGHVNNTVYFRYLEIVRIEWMRAIGCEPDPRGEGPVIVNAFCNFHKQLEYPGDVLATLFVSDPGRSSFESWCTLSRSDDPDTLYASGGATTVWVNFPLQKSAPLPDHMRTLLT
ncbi:thioesterase family protein [Hydrogenophaga sp.]|jgi:acyl-CoA thioester hydrolase|uniref:acyl-CoA thioesterase n=1 Tax=Hydrogenophaga sp. TaxID=1904254 RepID=UPI00260AF255|nr:thioesterase family protein [Hydrogenophaga sp.]MDM7950014.1 thioesterase family protein [Hydrogenophaga sp.]